MENFLLFVFKDLQSIFFIDFKNFSKDKCGFFAIFQGLENFLQRQIWTLYCYLFSRLYRVIFHLNFLLFVFKDLQSIFLKDFKFFSKDKCGFFAFYFLDLNTFYKDNFEGLTELFFSRTSRIFPKRNVDFFSIFLFKDLRSY